MSWPRKTVLLLMALLMVWTTVPAVACAASVGQDQPVCCRNMAIDCSQMMSAERPCCQLSPQRSTVEVVQPFSPEQAHQFFLAAQTNTLQLALNNDVTLIGTLSRPVPSASPGISTILRI